MRRFVLLLMFFLLAVPLVAQDEITTPYEIALQRIEDEQRYGMKELNLSELGLTELPPELWQLTQLEYLYLYGNELTSLPPEIGTLTQLKILDLSGNQLTDLPAEIGQLTQLERLFLSDNQLTQLPSEMGHLIRLDTLAIAENRLVSLPPEIGQLPRLCDLDVQHNQLKHLPHELGNTLRSTDTCPESMIWLDNNPLITPPPEILAQWTPGILVYLREQAWYHTRGLLLNAASGVGLLAGVMLVARWRYRRNRKPKAKRAEIATH